jgi:hypothetical protein
MIKLFGIVNYKTHIKGYWIDNTGKLYRDNIVIQCYYKDDNIASGYTKFLLDKRHLFKTQLAVFYINGNTAIIEDTRGKRTSLHHKTILRYKHLRPSIFKALLKQYNGFAVYKNKGYYLIEIWQE